MSRKKLSASSLQSSIAGHLVPDAVQAHDTCAQFLEAYEMPAGVVTNLIAAKKHLQLGVAHAKAAQVIVDFEVEN